MQRVMTYLDRSKDSRLKQYWPDLPAMPAALHKTGQQLAAGHLFTARILTIRRNAVDAKRQSTFIDASSAQANLTGHEGQYLEKPQRCNCCGGTWKAFGEETADVNITAQTLTDAYENRFDKAFFISGDSDLTTPIQRVRKRFPNKRLIFDFQPNCQSVQLKKVANHYLSIGEDRLRQHLSADPVITASGFALHRPAQWR